MFATHRLRRSVFWIAAFLLVNSIGFAGAPVSEEPGDWLGYFFSYGQPHQLWSIKQYDGYETMAVGIFREWVSNPNPIGPIPFSRHWRAFAKVEHFYGDVELAPGQVPLAQQDGGPYYAHLDHYQLAFLLSRRWVLGPRWKIHPTANLGAGLSIMNDKMIEDGTLHNYNLEAGYGLEWNITHGWVANADVEYKHFSNGGRMYLSDKDVIGPEDVNLLVSLRHPF